MVFVREDQLYPHYGGGFTAACAAGRLLFYPGWDAGLAPSVPLGAATVANDLVFTTLETVS
jgi:hypothetical protein